MTIGEYRGTRLIINAVLHMDNNLVSLGSKLMTENVRGKRGNCYRNEKQELWCV